MFKQPREYLVSNVKIQPYKIGSMSMLTLQLAWEEEIILYFKDTKDIKKVQYALDVIFDHLEKGENNEY